MINRSKKTATFKNGFTIIEVVVVIVIIGILATITVVSYGSWRKSTLTAQVKSDLNGVVSAMENARTFNNAYPVALPTTMVASNGVSLSGGGSADGKSYCVDGASVENPTITYYVDSSSGAGGAQQGTCATRPSLPAVPSGLAVVSTTTSQVNLSWTAVAGATSYTAQCASDTAYTVGTQQSTQATTTGSVSGLNGASVYYCHVRATNTIGSSGWSANVTATPYVPASHVWKQIATASWHTCAIASDDLVYCWGGNSSGELGNNSTINSLTPVAVSRTGVLAGKTVKSISTVFGHTCAVASDNLAYCWGWNSSGQLGNGSTANSLVPVAVTMTGVLAGKTINSISANNEETCAVASDNLAYCWGKNYWGQLGNNSTTNSSVPVAVYASGVLAGKTIKSISAGGFNSCVIASDNLAYCWGYNAAGQLGNNSTVNTKIPVTVYTSGVLVGKTVKSIKPGSDHTCALASDNQAYCWGAGLSCNLGDGACADSSVPVAVSQSGALAGKTIKSLVVADTTSCVIASDNQVYCWGYGSDGSLGNGIPADAPTPVPVDTSGVLAGKTVKFIDGTCAIASDNQAYCWGSNGLGRLGNNSTTNSLVPVAANSAPSY